MHALRAGLMDSHIGAITAVHGIPGIGKSMLAFAYAWGYGFEYPGGRFLIPAANLGDLAAGVIALAEPKGVVLGDERLRGGETDRPLVILRADREPAVVTLRCKPAVRIREAPPGLVRILPRSGKHDHPVDARTDRCGAAVFGSVALERVMDDADRHGAVVRKLADRVERRRDLGLVALVATPQRPEGIQAEQVRPVLVEQADEQPEVVAQLESARLDHDQVARVAYLIDTSVIIAMERRGATLQDLAALFPEEPVAVAASSAG